MPFRDRREAGRRLGEALEQYRGDDAVVLALPRGGVPVAYEVARCLDAPLDVLVVRKLGHPSQPELAVGAIGEGEIRVLNEDLVRRTGLDDDVLETLAGRESDELARRVRAYRGDRSAVDVTGRTAIVVDDGLATGATARAGIAVLRARGAGRIVLAVPVAPADTVRALESAADDVVCLEAPTWFGAVGEWYADFSQTTDDEVEQLLAQARADQNEAGGRSATGARDVSIALPDLHLPGLLTVPKDARGVVVFAHGSGSSRLSPRNRVVGDELTRSGFATLLFDLLTDAEAADRDNVFDIPLLAGRLIGATDWLVALDELPRVPIGYFGASTGAAAALWAAGELGNRIAAVVSRGGRPDLSAQRLPEVTAPTLLIVGARDEVVLDLNREAAARLRCPNQIEVVAGATHLFEEPGALEEVARLSRDWFRARFDERQREVA